MFLKRERRETDDFAMKNIWFEVKILFRNFYISRNNVKCFTRQPYKKIMKISLHILAFQKIPSIFYFFHTQIEISKIKKLSPYFES